MDRRRQQARRFRMDQFLTVACPGLRAREDFARRAAMAQDDVEVQFVKDLGAWYLILFVFREKLPGVGRQSTRLLLLEEHQGR
jgi:hypothetical protein